MSQPINSGMQPIAYLVSQYPATSHTFILREVTGLRRCGFSIATASINADQRPFDALTAEEQAERERTYVVKRHGVAGAVAAHAAALWQQPAGYWRGLRAALKRSIANPRKLLRNNGEVIGGFNGGSAKVTFGTPQWRLGMQFHRFNCSGDAFAGGTTW